MDLICWKIMLTKGMSQFMGTMGESIPTDIIHILNPEVTAPSSTTSTDSGSKDAKPRRRRHSYHHQSQTFSSAGDSSSSRTQHGRSQSVSAITPHQKHRDGPTAVQRPQVWIRVPEPDLTTVWTALSGFSTQLDTGNYGTIDAGIRVVRASRYLTATTGPLRNKW